MSLTPSQIDRANRVLSGPLAALIVNPAVSDGDVSDTTDTLAQLVEDFLHVIGSSLEVQADCGIDVKAVARTIWLTGNLFELYRALSEQRP